MSEMPAEEPAPDAALSARERWCWIERARAAARRAAESLPPGGPEAVPDGPAADAAGTGTSGSR